MCVAACGSTRPKPIPTSTSAYDVLPPGDRAEFDTARREMDAGRMTTAHEALAALARRHPENLVVGVWQQEVELRLGAAIDTSLDSFAATEQGRASALLAAESLRQSYRRAAEASPSVARLVLAARLEPDVPAARLLLDRAEELDADCAWIHYGRAYLAARTSDWPEVRVWIARAIEADPGHMPTRWLEAWMLAQGGNVRDAIAALESWLDRARDDLRLDARLVRGAELDLALLSVLDGAPERARDLLEELEDDPDERGRRLSVLASAEQALDRHPEALAAAQRAEAIAPGELLPVVQQALLYDTWLGDPEAAEAAWTRVLAISRASPDLKALLELMRARVRLERFQERRQPRRKSRHSSAAHTRHGGSSRPAASARVSNAMRRDRAAPRARSTPCAR